MATINGDSMENPLIQPRENIKEVDKMRRTKAQKEASMRNIKKAQAARRRKTHEKRHKRKFR